MHGGVTEEELGGAISHAQCQEIARAAISIWKTKVGRGPVHASAFASKEAIALVMRGVLTPQEQALVEDGRVEHVRDMRRQIFEVNCQELVQAVEQTSGRKVATALYDAAPEHDTSALTFVLESGS